MKLLASEIPLGTIKGIGPLGDVSQFAIAINLLEKFISTLIGLLSIIATIYFIFQIIMGGYLWLQSGGEKQAVQSAQKKLTNAFIGLIVVIASLAIVSLIGKILGIDILNIGYYLVLIGMP